MVTSVYFRFASRRRRVTYNRASVSVNSSLHPVQHPDLVCTIHQHGARAAKSAENSSSALFTKDVATLAKVAPRVAELQD